MVFLPSPRILSRNPHERGHLGDSLDYSFPKVTDNLPRTLGPQYRTPVISIQISKHNSSALSGSELANFISSVIKRGFDNDLLEKRSGSLTSRQSEAECLSGK